MNRWKREQMKKTQREPAATSADRGSVVKKGGVARSAAEASDVGRDSYADVIGPGGMGPGATSSKPERKLPE